MRVGGTEEVQGAANIIYVTLRIISRTKVMTRSQHANTTHLVCPKTHSLCAYLIAEAINDTLCFVSVYLAC